MDLKLLDRAAWALAKVRCQGGLQKISLHSKPQRATLPARSGNKIWDFVLVILGDSLAAGVVKGEY